MEQKIKTVVVQTPGDIGYLHRIREFIAGMATEAGIDPHEIDNIELAVDEACTNVIEHGYAPDDTNKELTIRMEIDTSKLVLTVIDRARPFNILHYEPRDINDLKSEGKDGGLGIRLIKHIMDDIDYQTKDDGQNELTMTKYFSPVR
jgi:anti-sigma regulatory factor (Ser/Thr protein kinase)